MEVEILHKKILFQLHFELILHTLDVVPGLEGVERSLILDQLALVLFDPLPVPVDVERPSAVFVE